MKKNVQFKKQIISAMTLVAFLFIFQACQPSADSTPLATKTGDILIKSSNSGQRVDQSYIESIDNQIQLNKEVSRSIPGLEDSSVSYCESVNGETGKYNGVRDLKKYPLASLSKIFLTAWALDKLGPDFKFDNLWYFKKVSEGLYDVYFKANYDPALNIEKILYAMSLLSDQGVKKIRRLVIDESTRVYLSVLVNPHVELSDVPVTIDQSVQNLKIILNSEQWGSQTDSAKINLQQFSLQKNRNINIPNSFSVDQVVATNSTNININDYAYVLKINSSSLLKYLKYINVNSNNYMSDAFFYILGGASEFKKFQQSRLNLTNEDLEFYTGSGLSINTMGIRTDNIGSCVSVLKTLKFINELSKQIGFDMGHVLLTAGVDNGTYEQTLPIAFNSGVVLKTGRLFDVPALNVAGTASLSNGTLFFSYMAHGFNNDDESVYKNKRDQIINSILNFYPVSSGYKSLKLDTIFFD